MFTGDDKETAFVRYATGNQRGVLGREQGDVGVGYGLALLVDDGALVAEGRLLQTLHYDFPVLNGHEDRIKTYHLADGVGHGLAVYRSGDAEVLQLVVEETDGIVLGLLVQLAQGLAQRHVVVFACNLLGLHSGKDKAADKH